VITESNIMKIKITGCDGISPIKRDASPSKAIDPNTKVMGASANEKARVL
jgi:hypothetical protein